MDAANNYIEDLYKRFQDIAEEPRRYPAVEDIRPGYRRSVFRSDSIYYRINDDVIEIMAIIGQQDLKLWL